MKAKKEKTIKDLKLESEKEVLRELGEVVRLNKDLKALIKTLGKNEVRCIVDYYYMIQENRKRSSNQIAALSKSGEPHSLVMYLNDQTKMLESQIAKAMDEWTDHYNVSKIIKDKVYGIGPVISAGLVAHIDITKAKTAGSVWRYAGLDPTSHWGKGEKRPWNASLKTLCWKIGQSFMKFSNKEDCFYGQLYRKQKDFYVTKNESGGFADLAKSVLESKNFKKKDVMEKYKSGILPDGHVDAMARRWAVKLFLSNLHELWCKVEGIDCPKPYVMAHLGHVHHIIQPDLLDVDSYLKKE
jgi:hypothetical protein